MKSTGIVREIDKLGRIVLPVELRRSMEIATGDLIEIYTDNNSIILKKQSRQCTFCGGDNASVSFKGRYVCQDCADELKRQTDPKPVISVPPGEPHSIF